MQQPDTDTALRRFGLDSFAGNIHLADNNIIAGFTNPGAVQKLLNKLDIAKKTLFTERSLKVDETVFDVANPAYFDGYWQSEDYFKENEILIRKAFSFKKPLNEASLKLADQLIAKNNTVSIHIRRGDYTSSVRTNKIHGTCSVAYYLSAVELLKSKIKEPVFYLFTDEPAWVIQSLMPKIENAILVEHNPGDEAWQDIALMSQCSHHIIANSSFSWWGAWLNPDKQKTVVAPKNWFNTRDYYFDDINIVPKNWIKLAND